MVNLHYVVNLVRMDRDEYSTHSLQKILQYVILGYRELKFKVFKNVEVMRATPNDALIIPLPMDYEYYTKIGFETPQGIFVLSYNPALPLSPDVKCGTPVESIVESCSCPSGTTGFSSAAFYPFYSGNQFYGELYAYGGGVKNPGGYFKIDTTRHQIQFSNIPKVQMYMEYVASGDIKGSTLIPTAAVQSLRHYAHMEISQHQDINKLTIADKQQRIANYTIARNEFALTQLPSLTDFLDAIYSGYYPMKL